MTGYKKELALRLGSAVAGRFPGAECKNCVETDTGFFCDFDIPPVNARAFSEISEKLDPGGIDCAFELCGFSAAYEGGDAENRSFQRIHVLAFATEAGLLEYKAMEGEAQKRDHKRIGAEQDLFSVSDGIGRGLVLWHPRGAMLRYIVESFGQRAHMKNGYDWVCTPHIGRSELWQTSGHLEFYKDSMYSPMEIDGEEYYLKPMNCPFHIGIYNSGLRSYRDLPVRYAEYGTVYRYELSGALGGLVRVRGFTQDDAHIICTPDQIEDEVQNALAFSLYILRSFGLIEFRAYISTKPERKFIGRDEDWETATEVLKKAVLSAGLPFEIDEGGGAFYGPKIDLKLFDSMGREWQCSTIQFDFNLPGRFEMSYVGADGGRHTPFMIHRALFGSIERFAALLIEHYAGDFPLWLAPVQVCALPVKERHGDAVKKLVSGLKNRDIRAEAGPREGDLRGRIKEAVRQKTPYILVVGDREAAAGTFSARGRREGELGTMDISGLLALLEPELRKGEPEAIF